MKNGKTMWYDMYGLRPDDFILGVIAGVEMYAVWKDSKQVVGISEEPLKDVIKEIKEQLGWNIK